MATVLRRLPSGTGPGVETGVRNLVLTGFMGTGKSTVARLISDRYGLPLADVDQEIERRTGRSIREIFASDGQPAFRDLESQVFGDVLRTHGQVVATGAGTLTSERNRALLAGDDRVFSLVCQADELLRRLGDRSLRPMLRDMSDEDIVRFMKERSPLYARYEQIDTAGRPPEAVADAVAAALDLSTVGQLKMAPSRLSRILFGRGLLSTSATRLIDSLGMQEALLVTDDSVRMAGWSERMRASLIEADIPTHLVVLHSGEQHKTLDTVHQIYTACMEAALDRDAVIIGVGGGVVGDVAGMVAATYLRGLRLVLAPTTLLAQVDASIGGKVGVDLDGAKNLVGAFHPADTVIIDPDALATLPTVALSDGLAEMVKIGAIRSYWLLAHLEALQFSDDIAGRPDLVRSAALEKIRVVDRDPFESGERALLNFGHTIGHGVESASGYRLRHGEAVAIGMVAETWLGEQLGVTEVGICDRIAELLRRFDLPLRAEGLAADLVLRAIGQDKKRRAGQVRVAIPRRLGEGAVIEVSAADVEEAIASALEGRQ